jgi:hypothetical protein
MVQPFAQEVTRSGHDVFLIMHKMDSTHFAEPKAATQYSDDGMNWKDIPAGVQVLGSRYALLLSDLTKVSEELNVADVEVAVGPSRGKLGSDYIKGRVDKACLRSTGESKSSGRTRDKTHRSRRESSRALRRSRTLTL